MHRILPLLMMTLLLAACSSMPESLRGDYGEEPGIAAVQAQPKVYLGQKVRWGGVIIDVENLSDHSVVEILAYPLDDSGRPRTKEHGLGRFLVHIKGFIDPATYAGKRESTATGTIKGVETRKIGDYPYRYPVLEGRALYLWPERQEPEPLYNDPWYPWYGPYRYHP